VAFASTTTEPAPDGMMRELTSDEWQRVLADKERALYATD